MSEVRCREKLPFSLRLRTNIEAPVLEHCFTPYYIYAAGRVEHPVTAFLNNEQFITLEPETFVPLLARFADNPRDEILLLSQDEIEKFSPEVLVILPHGRSLGLSPDVSWSFQLHNWPFRLVSAEDREFVLRGVVVRPISLR